MASNCPGEDSPTPLSSLVGEASGVWCVIWLGRPSTGVAVPSLNEFVEDSARVIGDGRCCFVETGVFGGGICESDSGSCFAVPLSSREDLLGFLLSSGFSSPAVPAYGQLD